MIIRIIGNVVGAVLFIGGIPLLISPIPLGLIVMVLGLILLIAFNPWVAKLVRYWRQRSKRVDQIFKKAEEILPDELAEPLHDTDVGGETDTATASAPPMRRVSIPRLLR
ncbi:MAG: hypothetical protein V2I43_10710 [Parvularcula sp.]|jgi:UPF0716 family protein affecting phage T7 exclusion|nr:hypothetical protein [Parvularcula sp.]